MYLLQNSHTFSLCMAVLIGLSMPAGGRMRLTCRTRKPLFSKRQFFVQYLTLFGTRRCDLLRSVTRRTAIEMARDLKCREDH